MFLRERERERYIYIFICHDIWVLAWIEKYWHYTAVSHVQINASKKLGPFDGSRFVVCPPCSSGSTANWYRNASGISSLPTLRCGPNPEGLLPSCITWDVHVYNESKSPPNPRLYHIYIYVSKPFQNPTNCKSEKRTLQTKSKILHCGWERPIFQAASPRACLQSFASLDSMPNLPKTSCPWRIQGLTDGWVPIDFYVYRCIAFFLKVIYI